MSAMQERLRTRVPGMSAIHGGHEQGDGAALGVAVGDRTQVPQAYPAPVGQRDVQVGDAGYAVHSPQAAYRLHRPADVPAPTGGVLLDALELGGDVPGGHPQGLHAGRVQVDLHLAVHAPHPRHLAHPGHRQDGLGNLVVHEPGQGLVHV